MLTKDKISKNAIRISKEELGRRESLAIQLDDISHMSPGTISSNSRSNTPKSRAGYQRGKGKGYRKGARRNSTISKRNGKSLRRNGSIYSTKRKSILEVKNMVNIKVRQRKEKRL